MSNTITAIAMYKPNDGQRTALIDILKEHIPTLKKLDLITDKATYLAESTDGTFLEVFEWKGEAQKNAAHADPAVRALWGRMMEICTFPHLENLPEAKQSFPGFASLKG